jgi:hypothetical protein
MTDKTPEELSKNLKKRFGYSRDNQTQAMIIMIWLVGVMQRLAGLGVISGGEMKEIDGIDQWDAIDQYRYRLIPPNILGGCLEGFTTIAAVEELREELARIIALYYTDKGRQEIISKSLNRIFLNSPSK